MCGIYGAINEYPNLVHGFDESALTHRGPDSHNLWRCSTGAVAIGHLRLAIIDLSPTGSQPMHSRCGRYVLAFNGEIYNHQLLRLKLNKAKSFWFGSSDTETLLACIVEWGIQAALKATLGMFSFALWDKVLKKLVLARDRMGEKPLYWGWSNNTLLFGSELKAIKSYRGFDAKVDRDALSLLLRYNYIPAPHSIYQGIEKLPAGHWVEISMGQKRADVTPKEYWSIQDVVQHRQTASISKEQAIDRLGRALKESVEGQMLADVPLGAFLSGGVDSSLIVALMQKQSRQKVKTFSIGFDDPAYNEAEHAKAVAKHLGTEHTEMYVTEDEALDVVKHLPRIYCEPIADSSQIPTYLVSKMTAKHVTVALSGDGGDELFAGYNPYRFGPRLWQCLRIVPLCWRKYTASLVAGWGLSDRAAKLIKVLPACDRADFYQRLQSHWPDADLIVKEADTSGESARCSNMQFSQLSDIEFMMACDSVRYLPDDVLVKVDRAAMANSLETRVPLLDHRIVELAWQLPLDFKLNRGEGKWILKQLLYRYVPKKLLDRPKKGFSVPLASWLRGPLKSWADELLLPERLQREGYFNEPDITKAWQEHLQGKRDHAKKLWSILMFQAWLEHQ